ncbi:gap junction delta-4 protein [Anguilla anguilla]|uniref:gap junction delta-4 protein n=1 Tax=Anguilla anguilla TaxID=7936 RepID=UPI0015AB1576|nr:gap junction delta-4 protein [Anguilla anguilla]
MGRQSAAEVLFLALNHNITIVGKIWLVLMVLLRVLVLLLAGYPLYQDEQERFVCNTIQPGCANVCYDVFSPLSLFRFWLVQLTTLCLPYLVFVVHVVHKVSRGLAAEGRAPGRAKAAPPYKARREPGGKAASPSGTERGGARSFTAAYVVHLLLRMVLEAGFGVAHYYLFGFHIPKQFLCQQAPCTTTVDCYISRPTEKTVMLNFMLAVSALSFLLNFADLVCAIEWSVQQRSGSKTVVEKAYEEEQYYLSPPSGRSVGAELPLPLARDLVTSAAFRKRAASKSSTDEAASVRLEAPGRQTAACDGFPPPPPPLPLPGNGANANGNNVYVQAQEDAPEREGSDAPLCPTDARGTPRSIRVCKHSRLKPPPPPRRDKAAAPPTPELCGRRVGQYTLVELASELQSNSSDMQEKRSEWV